jgi:predicted acyl esterase
MELGCEYANPIYRVEKGYAIVNIDARGSWNSEGNMYYWGNNVRIELNFRIGV